MIFDILEQKLINAGFVSGQTLFRNFMPADISIGVMTRIPLQGMPIDPNIPNYYKGEVQVITRHKDAVLGSEMANSVQRVLTVASRQVFAASSERGEVHLDLFYPVTLPISFPRLDGNTFEWSQHYRCVFGMKPL